MTCVRLDTRADEIRTPRYALRLRLRGERRPDDAVEVSR
jgi:hypothetical protein